MLVENHYPQDTRVRNEAMLLAASGYQVVVVCLRKSGQTYTEVIGGVRVYRLPRVELFKKTAGSKLGRIGSAFLKLKSFLGYLVEYGYFTSACFVMCGYVLVRHGFNAIHAHNPPDTLFLAALPFKLLGKKFVFDHHDLCPELYRSRYGAGEGVYTRMLRRAEWCSLRLANIVIATNESYKQVHLERGKVDARRIYVVRNGPDTLRMTPAPATPRLRAMKKNILCYVGSLNPQDGVDYLLRALAHLLHELKRTDFYCVIMGSGDSLEDLRAQAAELRLTDHVELTGFVSDAELQANLSAADICMDPDPSSPLNDVSTWIKIMEYMAYAKPIVSFDLKESRYSAQDAAIYVSCNDESAFAEATAQLMDDALLRERMGRLGRERVVKVLQWSVVGQNLITAYAALGIRKHD